MSEKVPISRVEFAVQSRGERFICEYHTREKIDGLLEDTSTRLNGFLRELARGGPIAQIRIQVAYADGKSARAFLDYKDNRDQMSVLMADGITTVRDVLIKLAAMAAPAPAPQPAN